MTQADRDRLVTLKKAKKKLITQREAAEELGVSTRHVKRLLCALKKRGDKAVIHGLRRKPSNRRIAEATEKEAVKTLSAEVTKVWADLGSGLFAQEARDRGEQGDRPALDDAGQAVACEAREGEEGARLATAT